MGEEENTGVADAGQHSSRLAILLAAAMFVLVVDTSLMNVSISAVVKDLDTTVSGVQSAIALEALVSAAFILISSKVGDLIGRKRRVRAGAARLRDRRPGDDPGPGPQGDHHLLGASSVASVRRMLLPAMQSLIHGNFDGAARKKTYALVGAAAAIAAAVGPLLGGFVTTYLSWRVGFFLEVVVIAVVLANIKLVRDVAYTGPRQIDLVGAALSVVGMGGVVLGDPGLAGGRRSGSSAHRGGAVGLVALAFWLRTPQAPGEADLARPGAVQLPALPDRDLPADAPADHPGRGDDRAADLLADDPRVQRDAGRALPGARCP